MKEKFRGIFLLCAAGAGLYLICHRSSPPGSQEKASAPSMQIADPLAPALRASSEPSLSPALPAAGTTGGLASESVLPVSVMVPATAPAGPSLPGADPSGLAPATVLENMRTAVRQYGQMFGGNPVGTNPEITRQLNGSNPKQANFIRAEAGMRINDKGELVDSWGTPYFFHQLSGTEMEIRSAGPDRILWTPDDLVTK